MRHAVPPYALCPFPLPAPWARAQLNACSRAALFLHCRIALSQARFKCALQTCLRQCSCFSHFLPTRVPGLLVGAVGPYHIARQMSILAHILYGMGPARNAISLNQARPAFPCPACVTIPNNPLYITSCAISISHGRYFFTYSYSPPPAYRSVAERCNPFRPPGAPRSFPLRLVPRGHRRNIVVDDL
jgi:hypothetical protein